jgi:polysaccharide biosynthesis/export protein
VLSGVAALGAPVAAGGQTSAEQAPAPQTQSPQPPASQAPTTRAPTPQTPAPQTPAQHAPAPQAPAAQQATRPSPAATPPGALAYKIGAGDNLHLFVWKEQELTREVSVRIDGKISVPLLGDIQAAGRLPTELAEEITNGLKRFLAAPVVTIAVNQTPSTRFFVLGMVGKSGDFSMTGPITVIEALAMAGGFREYAKTKDILIVRGVGRASTFVRVDYDRLVSSRDGSQNILLEPGDTVLVP